MKKFIKIVIALASLTLLASCDRFRNDTPIYEEFDFPRCQMPAALEWEQNANEITLKGLNIFPDAELYQLQFSDTPFPETGEPKAEDLLFDQTITILDFPFSFTAPAEAESYFRMRTLAPLKEKDPSKWKYVTIDTRPEQPV